MKKQVLYSIGLSAFFGLGFGVAQLQDSVAHARALPGEKAAYLIASTRVIQADGLEAYGQAAGPGARRAGMQMVARAQSGDSLQLLEGNWSYEGSLAIERFDSMDALLNFWHSPDYQAAKKLRDGKVHVNFIVALEAVEATSADQ